MNGFDLNLRNRDAKIVIQTFAASVILEGLQEFLIATLLSRGIHKRAEEEALPQCGKLTNLLSPK